MTRVIKKHLSFWLGIPAIKSSKVNCPFFSAKNATVTAHLLESLLTWFKQLHLLFYKCHVFAWVQIKYGNNLLLLSSLFISSLKRGAKSSFPTLVTCKTITFVTKEIIATDSVALKPGSHIPPIYLGQSYGHVLGQLQHMWTFIADT